MRYLVLVMPLVLCGCRSAAQRHSTAKPPLKVEWELSYRHHEQNDEACMKLKVGTEVLR
jgi:hypothetical protein